jgi:hypothetical protein
MEIEEIRKRRWEVDNTPYRVKYPQFPSNFQPNLEV